MGVDVVLVNEKTVYFFCTGELMLLILQMVGASLPARSAQEIFKVDSHRSHVELTITKQLGSLYDQSYNATTRYLGCLCEAVIYQPQLCVDHVVLFTYMSSSQFLMEQKMLSLWHLMER
ncbi:unnamed protein product [Eruca vesicaria subsp. sativa]|uniref:Uncharacterized protein n=1 Tax=Eruca vesicaria subsp. sativa TaxID=29727 RepID=A0ABC8LHC0_ERUVS|nr:unnamed protein product [Eruca vesicaria subsp. sativa]